MNEWKALGSQWSTEVCETFNLIDIKEKERVVTSTCVHTFSSHILVYPSCLVDTDIKWQLDTCYAQCVGIFPFIGTLLSSRLEVWYKMVPFAPNLDIGLLTGTAVPKLLKNWNEMICSIHNCSKARQCVYLLMLIMITDCLGVVFKRAVSMNHVFCSN